jgi:hypothetical protein
MFTSRECRKRAAEYREHAAACVKLAQTVADTEERACLVSLANLWSKLANNLEREAQQRADRAQLQDSPGSIL